MKHRTALSRSLLVGLASACLAPACLDPAAVDAAGVGAADARVDAADPFVEVKVGAIGVCTRTARGHVVCGPGAPDVTNPAAALFVLAERGARELAAGGTVIYHEELMACAVVGSADDATRDVIVCANGIRRYTLPLVGAHALAVGDFDACALDAAQAIHCWRPMDFVPPDAPPTLLPAPLIPDAVALAASAYGACALDVHGAVFCWDADRRPTDPPEAIGLPGPAVALSAGVNHACARLADGHAACWGTSDATPAPPLTMLAADDSLDAGGWATCVFEGASGILRCRQGDVLEAWSLGPVVQFDVGVAGVCGVSAEGALVCVDRPWEPH